MFEANIERLKKGGQHWAWRYEKPVTFIVVPRRKHPVRADWRDGETRYYYWKNCMPIHTGAAAPGRTKTASFSWKVLAYTTTLSVFSLRRTVVCQPRIRKPILYAGGLILL